MMNKTVKKFSNAFTMIELIIVIVILGIVSSISSSLIAQIYESYITQRALYTASIKTDLASKQIAARLQNRITLSVIGRDGNDTGPYLPIDKLPPGNQYTTLEWIGYDSDSFSANATPGWSGYCNRSASSRTLLSTPGSNLNTANTIIGELGGNIVNSAIFFNHTFYKSSTPPVAYSPYTMGFKTSSVSDTSSVSPITGFNTSVTPHTITLGDNRAKTIYDQYKLAWSAYAIVPQQQIDNTDTPLIDESQLYNLILYYNYQPWLNESYTDGLSSTLIENVTVFKFRGVGNTIHFKICAQEKLSSSETVNICKEKAVIR